MATMFEELMKGIDEAEAYLQGKREGYKVHVPGTPPETAAKTTATATTKAKCGGPSTAFVAQRATNSAQDDDVI